LAYVRVVLAVLEPTSKIRGVCFDVKKATGKTFKCNYYEEEMF